MSAPDPVELRLAPPLLTVFISSIFYLVWPGIDSSDEVDAQERPSCDRFDFRDLHLELSTLDPFIMRRLPALLLSTLSVFALSVDAKSQQPIPSAVEDWTTPYERSDGWQTAEYQTAIAFYRQLSLAFDRVQLRAIGPTDSGFPLHVVTVSADGNFDLEQARAAGRSVLLIINAIHPGESDGVDASMMLVRDLARDGLPQNVIVAVIPMYNIGGALNRNTSTRANQNGPKEYGFRGNAQNYDLNRDFVKCDTKNAKSFASLFQQLDPELLIDTHVSNGADYQYVMTSAHSQKDKLGLELGRYFAETFQPSLFEMMRQSDFETVPYVNSGGAPPDLGFEQFLETPRYSTGYAALFQTMGFMTETHMLKPYPQRVQATLAFFEAAIELLSNEGVTIQSIRRKDRETYVNQSSVPIAWTVNREQSSKLLFRGYQASQIPSRVTPGERLFYDRTKPYTKSIDYFDTYRASRMVELPTGYLVPQGWHRVIELMKLNGVQMSQLAKDATVVGEVYRIDNVKTLTRPYEGHYMHDSIDVTMTRNTVSVRSGDYVIPIRQTRARYIVETLEPTATDSLFRWNFFDTILTQKEHFSSYVFEDIAEKLLADDELLRKKLAERSATDSLFATDRNSQLQFIYEQSPHYETAHRTYPIVRLTEMSLFVESDPSSSLGGDDSPHSIHARKQ